MTDAVDCYMPPFALQMVLFQRCNAEMQLVESVSALYSAGSKAYVVKMAGSQVASGARGGVYSWASTEMSSMPQKCMIGLVCIRQALGIMHSQQVACFLSKLVQAY